MPSAIAQNLAVLLPPITRDELHWMELPNRFTEQTVRRICQNLRFRIRLPVT
jgi:hypothetical protein